MGINVTKATQRVFVLNKEKKRERERREDLYKQVRHQEKRKTRWFSFSNWSTKMFGTAKCKGQGLGPGRESLCLLWGPVWGTRSMCPGVTV